MRKVRRALKVIGLGFASVCVVLLAVQFIALEGLFGVVFSVLTEDRDNTAYAADYTDWKARWVRVGSSKEKVLSRLGEPLERTESSLKEQALTYWYYSKPKKKGDYHFRLLVFDEHGRLAKKEFEFYID